MASEKQRAANRENGKKGHGPKDTTRTRHNATKHALTAKGLTPLDDVQEYEKLVQQLMLEEKPTGVFNTELIKITALDILRRRRAARFEADCITRMLNPEKREGNGLEKVFSELIGPVVDPGFPVKVGAVAIQSLLKCQRYETGYTNRIFRAMDVVERRQRTGRGAGVPAPAGVAETPRGETEPPRSVDTEPERKKANESLSRTLTIESADADTEHNSAPAESVSQGQLPADGKTPAPAAEVKVTDDQTGKVPPAPAPWSPSRPTGPLWKRS